jgi:branched-chain amino acid transport system ATP-binding protein
MAEPLLVVDGLLKRFGGLCATDNVSLSILEGEIHALIGPNGAGKTTLIGLLTGELRADAGHVKFLGRDITRYPAYRRARLGIARSFQITSIFPEMTSLENVSLAVQIYQGHSFRFCRKTASDPRLVLPAREMLQWVGLEQRAGDPASWLSHGEHRQLEIAMALASQPKLLLLDEPLAGMSRNESRRMVSLLYSLKGKATMLLIEHDIEAVFELADRLSVLVYGRVIATGSGQDIRSNAEVRRAYLGEKAALT